MKEDTFIKLFETIVSTPFDLFVASVSAFNTELLSVSASPLPSVDGLVHYIRKEDGYVGVRYNTVDWLKIPLNGINTVSIVADKYETTLTIIYESVVIVVVLVHN